MFSTASSFTLFVVCIVSCKTIEIASMSSDFSLDGNVLNNNSTLSDMKEIHVLNRQSITGILGNINTFVGFGSAIIGIFWMAYSFATAPKYTVDDVMQKLDTEFINIQKGMDEIKKKIDQAQFSVYSQVETSVILATNDIKYQSTTNMAWNAVNLYNNLDLFLRGMLGTTTVMPDILKTTNDIYDCGSKSVYNQMDKFITLVNMGALGIGYYSQQLNNKTLFDGELRMKTLENMKNAVLCRVRKFQQECMSKNKDRVEQYIVKILSNNKDTDSGSMSKALYNRFDDIYQAKITWIFYVARGFPHSTKTGYFGDGISGETRDGDWVVYWAGTLARGGVSIQVDAEKVKKAVDEATKDFSQYQAEYFYNALLQQSFSSKKNLLVMWVFFSPPESSTIGNPISGRNVFLGIYKHTYIFDRFDVYDDVPVHIVIQ